MCTRRVLGVIGIALVLINSFVTVCIIQCSNETWHHLNSFPLVDMVFTLSQAITHLIGFVVSTVVTMEYLLQTGLARDILDQWDPPHLVNRVR